MYCTCSLSFVEKVKPEKGEELQNEGHWKRWFQRKKYWYSAKLVEDVCYDCYIIAQNQLLTRKDAFIVHFEHKFLILFESETKLLCYIL